MNIWKSAKNTQLLVLWAMHFGKRTLKQDSKMIGIKQYKLLAYDNNGRFV